MKISLETVREVLKDALGFDSFVAGFVNETVEDDAIPTASINIEGRLAYNSEFVEKHVTCKEDLFSLVFHELLHPMFCHFIYENGELENIAADAIINAVISEVYSNCSRNGNLFRKFYPDRGLPGLLRPLSEMSRGKYSKVYERLYSQSDVHDSFTTGELIQTLKILTQSEQLSTIVLIGSHSQIRNAASQETAFPNELLSRIAEDLKRSVAGKGGRHAGFSSELLDLFMEALKTHLSIKKVLLQKFLTKRKLDRFKEYFRVQRVGVSPIPLYPSKRDLVLLASGFYPGYFHNHTSKPTSEEKGLAIYLDVSGSVNDYLPKIIGVLAKLKNSVTSLFLFSNIVVETTMQDLIKGKIRTSYGTDFNCIAHSIIERRFEKAIIITDGYADMSEELSKQLKTMALVTLTILFDGTTECEDFAKFGDVVNLSDVCE
jgi:hypothetical protein